MGAHPLKSQWLLSPHLAAWQKRILADLRRRVPADRDVVWVLSSGTQSVNQVKCIGLKLEAVEASAHAVNRHLQAGAKDRWLIAIPTYHVGGYSIPVRARLSRSRVSQMGKWDARRFTKQVERERVTLTSLVPTQIFDLAAAGLRSPECLRAIVVGGGALDEALYARARALGWPVLPSYGLTETASQVATASLNSLESTRYPGLDVLSHAELEMRDGRLWIRADSACHWVAKGNTDGEFTLEDPRRDGWLRTEDIAEKSRGGWRIVGRADDVVKVLGVLVAVNQVESELREFFHQRGLPGNYVVLARPSRREGRELLLVTDSALNLRTLAQELRAYNARVPGPQRLKQLVWIPEIPRTDLGKIRKAAVMDVLALPS